MRITFERGDGAAFEAGSVRGGWAIEQDTMEQWGDLAPTVNTSPNVLTDGSLVTSKRVDEVDRTLTMVYAGDAATRAAVDAAQAFFNPSYSFEAHVAAYGRSRWAPCELTAFSLDWDRTATIPSLTATFLFYDPYWRDEEQGGSDMHAASPRLGWPFVSHVREVLPKGEHYPVGCVVSVPLDECAGNIYNTGDVPTFYRVVVVAKDTILHPTFKKDGKFVKVNCRMAAGQELVIDFEASPPTVTLDGEDVVALCTRDSNFTGMQMQVGKNTFSFTCDNTENKNAVVVQVLHRKRYLGV